MKAIKQMRPYDQPYDIMLIQRLYPFVPHYVTVPPMATQKTAEGKMPSSVGNAPKNESEKEN